MKLSAILLPLLGFYVLATEQIAPQNSNPKELLAQATSLQIEYEEVLDRHNAIKSRNFAHFFKLATSVHYLLGINETTLNELMSAVVVEGSPPSPSPSPSPNIPLETLLENRGINRLTRKDEAKISEALTEAMRVTEIMERNAKLFEEWVEGFKKRAEAVIQRLKDVLSWDTHPLD